MPTRSCGSFTVRSLNFSGVFRAAPQPRPKPDTELAMNPKAARANVVESSGFGVAAHLLLEAVADESPEPLVLPADPVGLCQPGPGLAPSLVEPGAGAEAVLESVRLGGKQRLLLVAAEGVAVRHNDELAPGMVLLAPGDQVAVNGGWPFEFALYSRPFVGVAPEEHRDIKCPLCSQPLGELRGYQCACGTFVHAEESEDGLQCAFVGSGCQGCGAPICFQPAYLGEPQFLPDSGQNGEENE
jgi:hypothetical protein